MFKSLIKFCVLASLTSYTGLARAEGEVPEGAVIAHRLVFVKRLENAGVIQLRVGEMLRIAPFAYPVIAKYLGAKLRVKLSGDGALSEIGQFPASNGEIAGRTGMSAFLYAFEPGRTKLEVTLVDENDREFDDFKAVYSVKVEE